VVLPYLTNSLYIGQQRKHLEAATRLQNCVLMHENHESLFQSAIEKTPPHVKQLYGN